MFNGVKQSTFRYLEPFRRDLRVWRTEGRTNNWRTFWYLRCAAKQTISSQMSTQVWLVKRTARLTPNIKYIVTTDPFASHRLF